VVVLTVNVAVNVLGVADTYVWVGFACVDVPPSPKVHEYVRGLPVGAVDPALENDTPSGEYPVCGVAEATAVGPS
jgi:hypothetical protein